jgi:hypothetical protein
MRAEESRAFSGSRNFSTALCEALRNNLLKSNCIWVIHVLVKTPLSGEGLAFVGAGGGLIPASVGR